MIAKWYCCFLPSSFANSDCFVHNNYILIIHNFAVQLHCVEISLKAHINCNFAVPKIGWRTCRINGKSFPKLGLGSEARVAYFRAHMQLTFALQSISLWLMGRNFHTCICHDPLETHSPSLSFNFNQKNCWRKLLRQLTTSQGVSKWA